MDVSPDRLVAAAGALCWKDQKVTSGVIEKGTVIDSQCLP